MSEIKPALTPEPVKLFMATDTHPSRWMPTWMYRLTCWMRGVLIGAPYSWGRCMICQDDIHMPPWIHPFHGLLHLCTFCWGDIARGEHVRIKSGGPWRVKEERERARVPQQRAEP
jgi:hypothetical protein